MGVKKKTIKEIENLLSSRDKIILAAEDDGKIAGFITGWVSNGVNYREGSFDIYIKNEFQCKGIGKKLMKELSEWFKDKYCKIISVGVYSSNKKANRFYEKIGFKLVSEAYKRKI